MKSFCFLCEASKLSCAPFRTGIKPVCVAGTTVPRSAFMSDLPAGDGARVENARREVRASEPDRRALRCLGPGHPTCDWVAIKSCGRQIFARQATAGDWRVVASKGIRAGAVGYNIRHRDELFPSHPMPSCALGRNIARHPSIRAGARDNYAPSNAFDDVARRGIRPHVSPAPCGCPISLKISRGLEFSFPVDIDLCRTDCQLIRKGEI
jgi:hypothetical protein